MDASEYCVALYESKFGKDSWAELEADVKKRHPELAWIWEEAEEELETKRWWRFWK